MLDTLQAFLALNLDVGSIRRVAAVQRTLRSTPEGSAASMAWVTPTNLHLAVRVLGDMDRATGPALLGALRAVAEGLSGSRVQLGAPEGYPAPDRCRLLLVRAADATGGLGQAVEALENTVQRFGFAPANQPVEPVLVLARAAEALDVTAWLSAAASSPLGEARVTELALYVAEIKHEGAEYTALGRLSVTAPIPARSHRPSRAPKPSQRPKTRSKPPVAEPTPAPAHQPAAIPKPPRLPSVAAPAPNAPAQDAVPARSEIPPPPPSRPLIAPLPPALEEELPDEDEWK